MAANNCGSTSLFCAHCEIQYATVECLNEDLLYCGPCSAALHGKRARSHHSVQPFKICDECEDAIARVKCAVCAGNQESERPLVFCVGCSAFLHSKKARKHHQVEPIGTNGARVDAVPHEGQDGRHPVEGVSAGMGQAKPKHEPDLSGDSQSLSTDLYISRREISRDYNANSSKQHHGNKSMRKSRASNMPMRRPEVEYEEEEISKDSSEQSYSEGDTTKGGMTFSTEKYRRGSVTLHAVVLDEDSDDEDAPQSTIESIVIMLKRGLFSGTSAVNAHRSVKRAQKCLTEYNLEQAGASEGRLQDKEALEAGSCMVDFVSISPGRGRYTLDGWTYNLALTVAKYFASEYCAQDLKVIFYGIKQNAMCAGHAFAATFNRVLNLSADFLPEKLLDEGNRVEMIRSLQSASKRTFCRKSRMEYRKKLVDALFKIDESSRWQQGSADSASCVSNGVSYEAVVSARRAWMAGMPKNISLVERFGYETVKVLMLHSWKVCKMFLRNKDWMVVGAKLKYPILS